MEAPRPRHANRLHADFPATESGPEFITGRIAALPTGWKVAGRALVGGARNPIEPVQTPSRHQDDRPSVLSVGIYAWSVYRKIATRLRRDGAENL